MIAMETTRLMPGFFILICILFVSGCTMTDTEGNLLDVDTDHSLVTREDGTKAYEYDNKTKKSIEYDKDGKEKKITYIPK
jgi:predicted RNA-binding protein associated with RNAse of E/G family